METPWARADLRSRVQRRRLRRDEFGFPRERIALGLEGGYDLGDVGMPAAVVETAAALVER